MRGRADSTSAVNEKIDRRLSTERLSNVLPVVREGWLYKRGGSHGGWQNWKRRWFVLIGDVLCYMDSRTDKTPRGKVALACCEFRNIDSSEVRKAFAFGIYHMTDMSVAPFFCAAESAQEAEEWLQALREAARSAALFSHRSSRVSPGGDGYGTDEDDELRQSPSALPAEQENGAATSALSHIAQLVREHEPRRLPSSQLEVCVVEARGLAAMDRNGLSDPYCVLHCGAVECRTRTIFKSLNPKWGESFRFSVASGQATVLQLDLYDYDLLTGDDFLGTLSLGVDDLLHPQPEPGGGGRSGGGAPAPEEASPEEAPAPEEEAAPEEASPEEAPAPEEASPEEAPAPEEASPEEAPAPEEAVGASATSGTSCSPARHATSK